MDWSERRKKMVEKEVLGRGIKDERVVQALLEVPRHLFLDEALWNRAYSDLPLPIGHQQTISRPYIVSLMTELLEPRPDHRILEIGTGSGYQAAVLSKLVEKVYTIERIPDLVRRARRIVAKLKIQNVFIKQYDGRLGWPEASPFHGIIVTAASKNIPGELVEQLIDGGTLVIPVEEGGRQILKVLKKRGDKLDVEESDSCAFVPLIEARK